MQLGAYNIVIGALMVTAGGLILRLNKKGWILAAAVLWVQAISVALSLPFWKSHIQQIVIRKRELQGIAVRANEIEFMQAATPIIFIAGFALGFLLLWYTYKKVFTAKEA